MSKKEEFTADSLLVDFNLSKYKMNPLRIQWNIDIGDRYDYTKLKNSAKSLYTIENYAETPEEKIKVKIASAAYILRGFENLKQKIQEKHDEFINRYEVRTLIESENPLVSELRNNFGMITRNYLEKVDFIQRAWYEDWKDFGEIEDYTPLSAKMYGVSMQERHRILDEAKAKYQLLYDHNDGNDENNPIKWWISNNVSHKLESYKKQQPKEWGGAPNAEEYSSSIVERKLQNYLNEIDKLPPDNLVQAYNHISKILNYLNCFANINETISHSLAIPFDERIRSIEVRKGYGPQTPAVKNMMGAIYEKMCAKYNSDNLADFVEFMQTGDHDKSTFYKDKDGNTKKIVDKDIRDDYYFTNSNTTTDILFELYFIRKSNNENHINFNIISISDMYRKWKNNGKKLKYYLPTVKRNTLYDHASLFWRTTPIKAGKIVLGNTVGVPLGWAWRKMKPQLEKLKSKTEEKKEKPKPEEKKEEKNKNKK